MVGLLSPLCIEAILIAFRAADSGRTGRSRPERRPSRRAATIRGVKKRGNREAASIANEPGSHRGGGRTRVLGAPPTDDTRPAPARPRCGRPSPPRAPAARRRRVVTEATQPPARANTNSLCAPPPPLPPGSIGVSGVHRRQRLPLPQPLRVPRGLAQRASTRVARRNGGSRRGRGKGSGRVHARADRHTAPPPPLGDGCDPPPPPGRGDTLYIPPIPTPPPPRLPAAHRQVTALNV